MTTHKLFGVYTWGLIAACALVGCRSIDVDSSATDVSARREHRKSQIARTFEMKRNRVQLLAAHSRLDQGDVDGCVEDLYAILDRDPEHVEALQLLDDIQPRSELATSHEIESNVQPVGHESQPEASPYEALYKTTPLSSAQKRGATKKRAAATAASSATTTANLQPAASATIEKPALATRIPTAAPRGPLFDPPGFAPPSEETPSFAQTGRAASRLRPWPTVPASFVQPEEIEPVAAQPIGDTAVANAPIESQLPAAQESLNLAAEALADGNQVAAARHLNDAVAAEPDNRSVATSAPVLALRFNQPELAIELAGRALRRFGQSADLYRILGAAYYRRGAYESSQVALQQALSLDSEHPLTYLLLGYTYSKLGDKEAAKEHLSKARQLPPGVVSRP